ncbi:hypothetical protein CALVIDRAFT_535997 [Calocera viscosa TUFC12733]|uniref:Uncharacterized protein n=1 Tax=Calocera viscosa (strain TUFC12733) TaxID=1330018 RepID=A0A167NNG4_CALVF|nr:hypothetical protein CALVIDRAFT_535997 [Calocera viscosa TUFC12733]
MSLRMKCKGDLWIDDHHTADTSSSPPTSACPLVPGGRCRVNEGPGGPTKHTTPRSLLAKRSKAAVGERRRIRRYGTGFAPLDEVRPSHPHSHPRALLIPGMFLCRP